MKWILVNILLLLCISVTAQRSYTDSIIAYQKDYVVKHQVVQGANKEHISFFAPDAAYRIWARFEKIENSPWFKMKTSGLMTPLYRIYGSLHFTFNNKAVVLNVYQSQSLIGIADYKDYLFIPFTDATNDTETYVAGRYIDMRTTDIIGNLLSLDFNKAYNPYCAYVAGTYNCPIPPAEINLLIPVKAGEKSFSKTN